MEQSHIIKYIKELPLKEKERFRQFVHSPYFNQHQKTSDFLDVILGAFNGNGGSLEKEMVFKRIFPNQPYHEQKLYNLMSYLKKLYQRFLAHQHFEKQAFQEQLFTLEAAYDNNQFDLLTNRAKQLEKSISQYQFRGSSYYFTNYRLNYLLGYYGGQYVDRSKSSLLQKMIDNLDKYYIAEKLKNCCHLTANMIMMNTQYEFYFLEELLGFIKKNWELFKDDPPIAMYYTILMSLRQEDNPEHYEQLKEMLVSKIDSLSQKENRDLYAFAYNYCIRKINHGQSYYQKELFQLYKQGLNNDLLLNNGILSEWDYKNIATLGCSLKEFEWTEQFIQEYKDKLPSHRRDNAYNYNLANLYYNKQMYNEAISALLVVQFTDVKYHLNTTFLLLRTYYALKDTEALLSLIETFRIYVMRNRKMTTDHKRGYTNFLRFAKKLVLLKHHASTYSKKVLAEKLQALSQKIENSDNVINRYWLVGESTAP